MNNTNLNHHANQLNANKGTRGVNSAYSAVNGNRGLSLPFTEANR